MYNMVAGTGHFLLVGNALTESRTDNSVLPCVIIETEQFQLADCEMNCIL